MLKKLVFAFCATALFGASAFGQTADELIEKNMQASAGADWQSRIKALRAIRMTGKIKIGTIEAPVAIYKARPALLRIDFTMQGMTGTQAFDGKTGWSLMPFTGKKDPERLSGDKARDMKDDADFDGPMVDYKDKGNKVELFGKVSVQGIQAYKLKVTTKSGREMNVYLDAGTYLEIRSEHKQAIQGQEVDTETNISNYEEVDGIQFPTRIQLTAKGRTIQTVTLEKIELNPTLEAMTFVMPGDQDSVNASSNDTASVTDAEAQASAPAEGEDSDKPLSADAIAKATGGSQDDLTGDKEGGSAHKKKQQKALTNEDVVAMVKAELGDKVVIDKINASPGDKLDTSADALIRLKKAGVSKAVIDAMIKHEDE